MDALPDEIWLIVLCYVGAEVVRTRPVSRRWLALADDAAVGRAMALAPSSDVVPTVSTGLAGVVFQQACSAATVASTLARYRRLRGIVVSVPCSGAAPDALDPPATLRHVHYACKTMTELGLSRHAETVVFQGDVRRFLALPNAASFRAVAATLDGHEGQFDDALRRFIESMTRLRYLQLQFTRGGVVDVEPPAAVDHFDTENLWPWDRPLELPATVISVGGDTVDLQRHARVRVLATHRPPDETFANLTGLVGSIVTSTTDFGPLSALTNLRFLEIYVIVTSVCVFYDALAQLPQLTGLCVRLGTSSRERVGAPVALPCLRRLVVDQRALPWLPPLPAVEVVVLRSFGRTRHTAHWYGRRRTPWTSADLDVLRRMQALMPHCDLLTYDEHDPLCLVHHAAVCRDVPPSLSVPPQLFGLPLSHGYDGPQLRCSCQVLTYTSK
jgi:hypothetical protein